MSLEKQFVISSINISKSAHRNSYKMTIKYYVSMWFSSGLAVISQEKEKKKCYCGNLMKTSVQCMPAAKGKMLCAFYFIGSST